MIREFEDGRRDDDPRRGTGRTTAGMLMTIARAIFEHGKPFIYVDHSPTSRGSPVIYAEAIRDLCDRLELKKMSIWLQAGDVYVRSDLLKREGKDDAADSVG